MRRKKCSSIDPFIREEEMFIDGKKIVKGDLIKIKGIWGTQFKFLSLTTNPKNGIVWVDYIELDKGIGCGFRSFYPERVRRIPKKRGKRVKRIRSGETS
jgi:hypothetical protein